MKLLDYLRPRTGRIAAAAPAPVARPPSASREFDASELPDMNAQDDDLSLGEAAQATHARAAPAAVPVAAVVSDSAFAAEREGLPPVNRHKGDRTVKVVVVVALIIVGTVLTVGFNRTPKQKTASNNGAISNEMPRLEAPPPPKAASLLGALSLQSPAASAPLASASANAAGQPDGHAIPVAGGAKTAVRAAGDGRTPIEWWDRKRMGAAAMQASIGGGSSQGDGRAVAVERTSATSAGTSPASMLAPGAAPPARDGLAARLEPTELRSASATVLADRNFLITKGTALDCALETAIDTTLPGILTCRLSRDVYSDNGQVLLLDRGTQLVGEQAGAVKQGQARVFALWNRAKTPAGVVISLNSPGTDALGRSGLEGWVDNHFIDRFGAAILMSIIQGAVNRYSTSGQTSGTTVYSGTAVGGSQIVEKILESTVNIPPTILKNQGDHIQVMVARDLDFSGVYALRTAAP